MSPHELPPKLQLRDGSTLELEVFRPEDAPTLQTFYRAIPEEDRLYLKEDVCQDAWAQRFAARVAEGAIICVVAKANGVVVGEGSLHRALHGWMRHVGELRITVAPDWRRKGLGRVLASSLVKIATDLGIEKIMAQVVEKQAAARRIFQKLGFHQEAVLPRHIQDLSGAKRDLYLMANDVSQIWAAMESLVSDYSPDQGA